MKSTYVLNFNGCNQRCLFCASERQIFREKKHSYRDFLNEITYAKKNGFAAIDFFGGEPTCYPGLKKLIQKANEYGMRVTLATNGINFSDSSYADNFFTGVDIAGMRTTLHSTRPHLHDTLTQTKNSFQMTIKGIRNILRYNAMLTVNVVITTLNYDELSLFPPFVYKLGVRGIKFSGLIMCGRALKNTWLEVRTADFLQQLIQALKISRELGFYMIECEKLPQAMKAMKGLSFIRFIDMR